MEGRSYSLPLGVGAVRLELEFELLAQMGLEVVVEGFLPQHGHDDGLGRAPKLGGVGGAEGADVDGFGVAADVHRYGVAGDIDLSGGAIGVEDELEFRVTADDRLKVRGIDGQNLIDLNVPALKKAWQQTFGGLI